jgi:hypothetical protein
VPGISQVITSDDPPSELLLAYAGYERTTSLGVSVPGTSQPVSVVFAIAMITASYDPVVGQFEFPTECHGWSSRATMSIIVQT